MRSYLLPPPRRERERPDEITAAVKWVEKASLPVAEFQEIARAHELIDALGRKLDGKPAATQTYRRRRAVVFNALEYAVELEALPSNPLSRVRRKREHGNVVAASSYSRMWKQAREVALLPGQVASVMAARPYDLRHAGVSQWLNSGVPAPEVAVRAGHSAGGQLAGGHPPPLRGVHRRA